MSEGKNVWREEGRKEGMSEGRKEGRKERTGSIDQLMETLMRCEEREKRRPTSH